MRNHTIGLRKNEMLVWSNDCDVLGFLHLGLHFRFNATGFMG